MESMVTIMLFTMFVPSWFMVRTNHSANETRWAEWSLGWILVCTDQPRFTRGSSQTAGPIFNSSCSRKNKENTSQQWKNSKEMIQESSTKKVSFKFVKKKTMLTSHSTLASVTTEDSFWSGSTFPLLRDLVPWPFTFPRCSSGVVMGHYTEPCPLYSPSIAGWGEPWWIRC